MNTPQLSKEDIFKIVGVSIGFDLVQAGLDFIPVVGWLT
jgi:uncharacterized protein (DUF697 family)